MKTYFLLFVATIGFVATVHSQATLVTQVPQISNGNSTLRAPNGTFSHTSLRAHFLLTPTEMATIPTGNNITTLGFVLNNGIPTGSSAGAFKIYLEATADVANNKSTNWTTAISTMTQVFNGTYTIPVTSTATTIDFTLTLPFAYTGTGLYIAYEYIASSTAGTAANYASNTDLAAGLRMINGTTTTPDTTLSGTSAFRPCMRIGIANPFSNDVEVEGILNPVGKINSAIQSSQSVVALIKNASNTSLTNVPVTMSVTGANAYSSTQSIANMGAGQQVQLTFTGLSTANNTIQNINISVPNDDDNSDNLLVYEQSISCDTIGFYNNDPIFGAVGYNTGTGCLANKHVLPNTAPVNVTSIGLVLANNAAAVGNTLKGILFDTLGVPIDSSNTVVITAGMLGNRIAFDMLHANSNLAGETVFIGIRQYANPSAGYFPFATQMDEFATLGRYYSLGVNGGNLNPLNTLGLFMLDAIIEPMYNLESNAGGVVCAASAVLYNATNGYPNYNFYVDGLLAVSGSSATFSYNPTDTHLVLVSSALNTCIFQDSLTIAVQLADTVNDTLSICAGDSYEFDGQLLGTSGSYSAIFSSIYGCDSIVNLELNVTDLLEQELEVSICDGESYEHLGQTLNATGIYVDTLTSSIGCDSVVTLDLTVNQSISVNVNDTICSNESYPFNGVNLTQPGLYLDTFQTTAGCDSAVTLLLAVTELELGILQTGMQLTALEDNATYQWLRCPTNKVISSATDRTEDFQQSGSYRVVISKFGCIDTSECQYVVGLGLNNINSNSSIKLFPNPTNGMVTIAATNNIESVRIIDLSGKVVLELNETISQASLHIDVSTLACGVYTVLTFSSGEFSPHHNLLTKY